YNSAPSAAPLERALGMAVLSFLTPLPLRRTPDGELFLTPEGDGTITDCWQCGQRPLRPARSSLTLRPLPHPAQRKSIIGVLRLLSGKVPVCAPEGAGWVTIPRTHTVSTAEHDKSAVPFGKKNPWRVARRDYLRIGGGIKDVLSDCRRPRP